MWWPWSSSDKPTGPSAQQNDTSAPSSRAERTRDGLKDAAGLSSNKPSDREKLPPKLQKIIDKSDKEDNIFDELVEG
jgi:fission process protein 1